VQLDHLFLQVAQLVLLDNADLQVLLAQQAQQEPLVQLVHL
jgi:hypothetical protein